MTSLFKVIGAAVIALALTVTGYLANTHTVAPPAQSFGSFTPVGGTQYTLSGSGVVANATTIPVTSFKTPDGRALTMSMFGSVGYAVIDPNSPSKVEDITFTGITQNSNGSAILTGVSRGMDFITPYAASSSLAYAHAGGAYLILSNSAGFYGQQFLFANSNSSSTALMTFSPSTPPAYYPSVGAQSTGTYNATTSEFASITYVNSVVAGGAANATTAVKGIVQLATAAQAALGTALGSTGASLVPSNSLFNATQSATTIIPVTSASGILAQGFIGLSQTFNWLGVHTFSAGLISTASSTFNPGTLHVGSTTITPRFGGTGNDGALSASSGTTVIALGTANYYEKDYTSISLTGTAALSFTSAATSSNGVTIVLKSQGACTFTSSGTVINLKYLGGGTGTGWAGIVTNGNASLGGGSGGGGGGSTGGKGADGGTLSGNNSPIGTGGAGGVQLAALASSTLIALPGGNGATGATGAGGNAGGAGGLGAGGLYVECAGAYNFTTGTIDASGIGGGTGVTNNSTNTSGGGGGGGGGGNILVRAGSITANTGTYTVTAGSAGAGGGSGGGGTAGASGGAGGAGSHLEILNTTNF